MRLGIFGESSNLLRRDFRRIQRTCGRRFGLISFYGSGKKAEFSCRYADRTEGSLWN